MKSPPRISSYLLRAWAAWGFCVGIDIWLPELFFLSSRAALLVAFAANRRLASFAGGMPKEEVRSVTSPKIKRRYGLRKLDAGGNRRNLTVQNGCSCCVVEKMFPNVARVVETCMKSR